MRTEKIISVNEKTPPSIITVVMSVFITVLLSTGFTFMYGTAIELEFKILPALLLSLVSSSVFAVIHFQNKRNLSLGALIAAQASFVLMMIFDWFRVRDGFLGLLYYIKLYAFYWFPGYYPDPVEPEKAVFAFLAAYNLIAISITTYLLIKRKFIPIALLCYAPLFIFSVANIIMRPSQWPCLISAAGVFLLMLTHVFRNKKYETAEHSIFIISVPLVALTLLTGIIFPEKKYKQDELAKDILTSMQESIDKAANGDGPLGEIIDKALNGFKNPSLSSTYDSFSPLYATTTNLSKTGPFNPPQTEVMKVYKSTNPDYNGDTSLLRNNILYLKIESLDKYENNTLSSTGLRVKAYDSNYAPVYQDAPYGITITTLKDSTVDIVPYYTDFYYLKTAGYSEVNPYNTTHGKTTHFASSPLPVKTGNIYTKPYLDSYVYNTALKVPRATENALTMSGKLPDWYMEVYMGHIEMSDADKVRGVTEFVRNLHPYNKDTDYPPEGADFVPWFVSDAESGICVHYAATTVILLRMIGVPARYVRGYIDTRSYNNAESVIYASQAHAWFEFFVPEYGWIMGDSTPGYEVEASYFDIDAVAKNHPDINTAPFSLENYKNASFDEPPLSIETEETSAGTETTENDPSIPFGSSPTPSVYPGMNTNESTGTTDTSLPFGLGQNRNDQDLISRELQARIVKIFVIILITAASILLLIAIVRISFVLHWKNRFKTHKINDKAVALYHYYRLMGRIFRFSIPNQATAVAEKAVFSGRDITSRDLNILITVCNEQMTACSKSFSRVKLYFYKLLRLKIR